MKVLNILLQTGEGAGGIFSSPSMLFLILMMVVMYFFFIRPQNKKRKEAEQFRQGLQKGDSVVTIGGIHGKVTDIQDTTVVISCESGKLKIEKSSISGTSTGNEQEILAKK